MPAAHFLGLRPGLVLAQHPDDLLLAKATPFHRPSPFQATDSTSFRLSFRGAGQQDSVPVPLCRFHRTTPETRLALPFRAPLATDPKQENQVRRLNLERTIIPSLG